MKSATDVRTHLKLALVDLDAAREGRRAGYAAMTTRPAMHSLERRVQHTSEEVLALMQQLISAQMDAAPALFAR